MSTAEVKRKKLFHFFFQWQRTRRRLFAVERPPNLAMYDSVCVRWCVEAISGRGWCWSSKWHYVWEGSVGTSETREGWPLRPCWNWGKWELKEYIWKGSFLGWFVGLVVPVQEIFCPALAALVSPVQKYFFLTTPYTIYFNCIQRPAAGQAVVPQRLSLNMCLWSVHYCFYTYKFYRNQPAYKIVSTKTTCILTLFLFSMQGGEGRRLRIWRRLFRSRRVIYARRLTEAGVLKKLGLAGLAKLSWRRYM